jgi:type IV pilus assembly protein PilP
MKHPFYLPLMLCLLLMGCRANDDSISIFISNSHSAAEARIEPLSAQFEFIADEFVMTDSRVPFVRPYPKQMDIAETSNKSCWQPNLQREFTALESYSLDTLTMKGVLGDRKQLWALIYTPEGQLIKIREGHYIGLNHGQVQRVGSRSIDIEEILPDGAGCWLKRTTHLALNQL